MLNQVRIPCRICHVDNYILVWDREIAAYHAGGLIQDAFPDLSAGERELMISQTCPACWDEIFPPELYDEDSVESELQDLTSGFYSV